MCLLSASEIFIMHNYKAERKRKMKKRILLLVFAVATLLFASIIAVSAAQTQSESEPTFTPGYRNHLYTVSDSYKDSKVWYFNSENKNTAGHTNLIAKNSNTSSALKQARSELCTVACKDNTVTIVLNGDATVETKFDNEGQIMGTVVIDLNGYTVDATAVEMINAQAKISNSSVYDSRIIYKNGNIVVGNRGLMVCGVYGTSYNSTSTNYKTMHYEFDNVNISFKEGTSCPSLIYTYTEDSTVGRVPKEEYNASVSAGTADIDYPAAHQQFMGLDISIGENCTLDLTNTPSGFTLFNACDPDIVNVRKECTGTVNGVSNTSCYYFNTNCITTINMNGGKIIAGENSINWYKVNDANGSYVKFGKGAGGNYTEFYVPEGSAAETSTVFESDDGKLVLMQSGGGNSYKMVTKEFYDMLNGITFVPKTSITLESSLVYNVYVPNSSELNYFVFDGKEYKTEADFASLDKKVISGNEYYLIKTELNAVEADREMTLYVNLDVGDSTASKTYTLSIPKYAAKIMASSDATGNEKVLAADILSYIRAAHHYFENNDNAKIDSILDPDYEKMSNPVIEGATMPINLGGIESATYVLESKPAMRFYLDADTDGSQYKFFIGDREIDTVYNEEDGYIDTDVYAYQLCETITYTADGENFGSYHINIYYEYAKSLKDDKLVTLVERFWKYLQSARAYREECIGNSEYAHKHSYLERKFEMSAYNPDYDEKVCACGDNEITQNTGIDFGDEKVSVYFLGNSYTNYNNMSEMFRLISYSMGVEVDVTKRTKGSWLLWKFQNPNDQGGATFHEDLENYDFDYAFIQDGSTQTLAAISEFYDGVRLVGELLEKDGAVPILYQTWGRKEGHAILEQYGLDTDSMARTVAAAYEAISAETGYTNSPAGSAFLDVYTNHPEIELYDPDLTHPSTTGSYLVALCHYATLFGRTPIGVEYTAGLDANTALILQTAAHNAVFGESIVTDEYKTSSEGIHVVKAENNLYEIPEGSDIISVGIIGDNGLTASTVTVAKDGTLTAEQKEDMSNIAYGVSVIGNKNMVTSLARATNGAWKSSSGNRLSFDFDGNYYDITGDVDMHEPYKALITYNFGGIVNITAIGYMSGNMDGFAQIQDVYISNDGKTWSLVKSASYDAILLEKENGSLHSLTTLPTDENGDAPGVCAVFDMDSANGGVWAKYVRFGIKEGVVVSNKSYDINTLELAVWGNAENSHLAAIPEGSVLISKGLSASEEFSATVDGALAALTAEQLADIADMSKYGMTLIGAKALERSIKYGCDGVWSGNNRLSAIFYDDDETPKKYDITGKEQVDGKYECLITYNFGEIVTLDAIGYMSGNFDGIAQSQEVWVSNDGVNWTKVITCTYDRTAGDVLSSVSNKPIDSKDEGGSGKASGECVMFDMGGIKAQYVRVAIIDGMGTKYAKDLNTYEIAVYGKKD